LYRETDRQTNRQREIEREVKSTVDNLGMNQPQTVMERLHAADTVCENSGTQAHFKIVITH